VVLRLLPGDNLMEPENDTSLIKKAKEWVIGGARSPLEHGVFHKLSLVAFFAWVGLGSDGLSSANYGPEEAYINLGVHTSLSLLVGLGTVVTIFVISSSYSRIIELFPTGGGGYLVASKLLSPRIGMISGCALLIDYVLTVAISVASGADAVFSFLPAGILPYKVEFALLGVVLLVILNLRGVKESVVALVPMFLLFVLSHAFVIVYSIVTHLLDFPTMVENTATDFSQTRASLGFWGITVIILKAYSMGAGTYTGIEAVSNGLGILREPRVQTGKRTMHYMAYSLSFMVLGLMISYLLYRVTPVTGKTLNAVLFDSVTSNWPEFLGVPFVFVSLLSAATILFVAAQTGFLGGPQVLANMALDRWLPTRFAILSDRLVTQNGILLIGIASFITMAATGAEVSYLVVLYSINVFITFTLSQMGMVRHWWLMRAGGEPWVKGIVINGIGLVLTVFILVAVTVVKFHEGGWITLLVTGSLIVVVVLIRRHYDHTGQLMRRLDKLVITATADEASLPPEPKPYQEPDPNAKTAVLLVNGFNGLGLHTLFSVIRLFGDFYKNYVFVQVGAVDAGNFKGVQEIERLQIYAKTEVNKYVQYMQRHGFYAEGVYSIGIDIVDEVTKIAPEIQRRFPQSVFFGGQLVFPQDTFITRWLHNYIAFSVQRRFYRLGIPFVILPIRVEA